MTDQADMEARAREWLNGEWQPSVNNFSREDVAQAMVAFEAERGAEREAAAYARAAGYIRGAGGVIPGANVFASLVSGNNQPCMSGDGRDRMHEHIRHQFDSATDALATAIEALGEAKG